MNSRKRRLVTQMAALLWELHGTHCAAVMAATECVCLPLEYAVLHAPLPVISLMMGVVSMLHRLFHNGPWQRVCCPCALHSRLVVGCSCWVGGTHYSMCQVARSTSVALLSDECC
jgi:hypothetical protein